MDQALYSMLRVNLRSLAKSKLFICKDWHIQPSEVDKLSYYEYEELIEDINEYNKEQEKRSKQEQEEYNLMMSTMPNVNNMQKNLMSGMKLPKMSIPNFK